VHQIKPIAQLSPDEIADLARAAADNGEPLLAANLFAPGTTQHDTFSREYRRRRRELSEAAA
jgi:hypothetical protein